MPVNLIEILRVYIMLDPSTNLKINTLQGILFDLYRDDLVMSDRQLNQFTFNNKLQSSCFNETRFDLFSDRMAKSIFGYHIDQGGKVTPDERTNSIKFEQLKLQLLSKKVTEDKLPSEICFLET